MIRYSEIGNEWISWLNKDGQGMPTTNLTGETKVCDCDECTYALKWGVGKNFDDLPK